MLSFRLCKIILLLLFLSFLCSNNRLNSENVFINSELWHMFSSYEVVTSQRQVRKKGCRLKDDKITSIRIVAEKRELWIPPLFTINAFKKDHTVGTPLLYLGWEPSLLLKIAKSVPVEVHLIAVDLESYFIMKSDLNVDDSTNVDQRPDVDQRSDIHVSLKYILHIKTL